VTLPPRIPRKPKRENRWRSQAHLAFVRGFACCVCGNTAGIEAAHVRLGSYTPMGSKPHDWRAVSLCGGIAHGFEGCHDRQHRIGEATFWREAGKDPEALIEAFCRASPKAAEIRRIRQDRAA
jgi:hypothetical protein